MNNAVGSPWLAWVGSRDLRPSDPCNDSQEWDEHAGHLTIVGWLEQVTEIKEVKKNENKTINQPANKHNKHNLYEQ